MKKREIFLVIALVLFGVIYQAVEKGKVRFAGDFSFYSDERKLKGSRFSEFPEAEKLFSEVERVTIENPAGEIIVNRSQDGQVHLIPLLRVYYKDKSDVEELRQRIAVKADLIGKELNVSVRHSSPFPYQRLRVLLRLLLPDEATLSVSNQEGDVIIKDVGNVILVRQQNGSLYLENTRSRLDLQLRNGNANLKNIAAHAKIVASHGNILIENAVSLGLVGKHGDCTLRNVEQEAVIEHSFGKLVLDGAGKVEIDARHCRIHARNIKGGAIISNRFDMTVLEDVSGDVRLSSRSSKTELRRASAGNVVIENSYADTRIEDFSGNSLDVLIKNGNLELAVGSVADRINIQSQHAELNLAFGVLADPTFNIRTRHGRITVESPLELDSYVENEVRFANRVGQKPEILINNSYGDVHVKTAR